MNKPTTCVLGLYTPLVDDPRIAADALAFWTIAKTEGTVASLETNAGIMADALGTPVAQPGLEAMARLPIEALHAHSVRLARMWAVRPQVREYSFDLWVHDFEAVIDAAGFPRVSLLGTCQSGPIAIEYAARHPERVAKLVLSRDGADGREAKILLDMLRLGVGR